MRTFINEDAFFELKGKQFEEDILFKGDSKISYITQDQIKKIIGCEISDAVAINMKNMTKKRRNTFEDIEKCPKIEDLIVLKELGAG